MINFQKDINAFFQILVHMYGLEGTMNYIHMLSTGHVSTYLFHYQNLYHHSQQGWEAINSLLKTFFFHHTQRGGSINGGTGSKTQLLPIGHWLQQRIIWLCGYDKQAIEDWCDVNPCSMENEEEDEEDIHVTSLALFIIICLNEICYL